MSHITMYAVFQNKVNQNIFCKFFFYKRWLILKKMVDNVSNMIIGRNYSASVERLFSAECYQAIVDSIT